MAAKAIILFACVSAFFVQVAFSQCLGRMGPAVGPLRTDMAFDGLAYDGLAYGPAWNTGRMGCGAIPAADIAAASSLNAAYGGGLPVASASAAAPTGLAVASENAYEGPVAVAGNLPFLGTVSMAGEFPTIGAGAVSYGCGDGAVAITAEGPIAGPAAIGNIGPMNAMAPMTAMAPMAAMAPAATIGAYGAPFGYAGLPTRTCGCGANYI